MLRRAIFRYFAKDLRSDFEAFRSARQSASSIQAPFEIPEEPVEEQPKKQTVKDFQEDFQSIKEDLKDKSGQASTFSDGLKQTFNQIKMPKMPNIPLPNLEKIQIPAKIKDKLGDIKENESLQQVGEYWSGFKSKLTIDSNNEYIQRTQELSSRTKTYVIEAWRETFPDKKQGVDRYQEQVDEMEEEEEKLATMTEEEIEEWKQGALVKTEIEMSKWEQVKEKVYDSKLAAKYRGKKDQLLENEQIKASYENYHEFKSNVSEMVETNRAVSSVKEGWSNLFRETAKAKALQALRDYDPDFSFFELEQEMQDIIGQLYYFLISSMKEELKYLIEGPAKITVEQFLEDNATGDKKIENVKDISNPIFLGVNVEDEHDPKVTFSVVINESYRTGETMTFGEKNTYNITIRRHPKAELKEYGHPWQVLEFININDHLRVTGGQEEE